MSQNNLVGELPEDLGRLRALKVLNLSSNRLSGCLPDTVLAGLSACEEIDLSDNEITGGLQLSRLLDGALPELRTLRLSHNLLTGSIPASIGRLASLETLALDHNKLTGKF